MNRCPITYRSISSGRYSAEGLAIIDRKLKQLKDLPFTKEELLQQAAERSPKMSVQGVQPKLSAILNTKTSSFEIVDIKGRYILKPQNIYYEQLPENEDVTMKLAETAGIEVPVHGLIYSMDNSLTYFIKRFDRFGRTGKVQVEDFAQLSGKNRDTKYSSSMEKVIKVIEQYCTFPHIEKMKLFARTIFNFLTGNEDMHLKNFSLITRNEKIELAPAYDFLNTTIALKNPQEELALPLNGKKRNITSRDLTDYFAIERMQLNEKIIEKELRKFAALIPRWEPIIEASFLNENMKQKYLDLLAQRKSIIL